MGKAVTKAFFDHLPTSSEFLAYCISPRAQALLNVSVEWYREPHAHVLSYEDLVADTNSTLSALLARLRRPNVAIARIVEQNRLHLLRPTAPNGHFWLGQPGIWRQLITAGVAWRICNAHHKVFDAFA